MDAILILYDLGSHFLETPNVRTVRRQDISEDLVCKLDARNSLIMLIDILVCYCHASNYNSTKFVVILAVVVFVGSKAFVVIN